MSLNLYCFALLRPIYIIIACHCQNAVEDSQKCLRLLQNGMEWTEKMSYLIWYWNCIDKTLKKYISGCKVRIHSFLSVKNVIFIVQTDKTCLFNKLTFDLNKLCCKKSSLHYTSK